jgi:hypothetical protein
MYTVELKINANILALLHKYINVRYGLILGNIQKFFKAINGNSKQKTVYFFEINFFVIKYEVND